MSGLFVPGWGADPALYQSGLPHGWAALRPPGYRRTRGELDEYARWLADELERHPGPVTLGGHSMGAAVAVAATLRVPERVERLVLLSPAGLPLTKPIAASLRDLARQLCSGWYPLAAALSSLMDAVQAPRAAARLVRQLRRLDLGEDLRALAALGIPCSVVGCVTDTLTTPWHCRRIAASLGAPYEEISSPHGHMWLVRDRALLAGALA